jgi:hypothetical protein
MNTDRAWFKSHRETNFRIRRGAPDEIERITSRATGAVINGDRSFLEFDHEKEWRVLVINAGPDTLLRMPILRPKNENEDTWDSAQCGFALVLGNRIVMDKIAG